MNPPIISIVGASGVGKTTFIEKLIPELYRLGKRVGTIKHDVHGFDMDRPGKDSWRHKQAGAHTAVISSPWKVGIVMDADHDQTPEELGRFFESVDLVITEGYKRQQNLKLEVFRPEIHATPLCRKDKNLLALITDAPLDLGVPRFSAQDFRGVADFLVDRLALHPPESKALG